MVIIWERYISNSMEKSITFSPNCTRIIRHPYANKQKKTKSQPIPQTLSKNEFKRYPRNMCQM